MLGSGTVVSHYRLVRRLGAGGMGEVYLADDTSLNRAVAIKFLITPDDENGRQRLLREARAAAGLDHPAICGVYEVGSSPDAGDFIVMQYVDGETLASRLKRGPLPAPDALRIAGQIAEALRQAHQRGVIHRDLKPQNVILTPAGAPKLLDFGLARNVESSGAAAAAETASPLTQPHAAIGTPGYMSPEQIRGRPADGRSDLFALGCVLYECLTGRRAFTGTTTTEVHAEVLHVDPPTPSSINGELGPAHDALCARLLAKTPSERFQSAEELVGAIRALTGTSRSAEISGVRSAIRSTSDRRRWQVVGAVAIIAAAAAVVWYWNRGPGLPVPPADAVKRYERGVELLREGSFASAKVALEEAVRLAPAYVQAYARLAEVDSELDDERAAQQALLKTTDLVPDISRFPTVDRLRLEAARATVLRNHDAAVTAYARLASLEPRDPVGWVELGRAQENAGRPALARAQYEHAVQLDSSCAVAHLRLGVARSLTGDSKGAQTAFAEAKRLYQLDVNVEAEAETALRQGVAYATINQLKEAASALQDVLRIAADPRFASQRVRARFELARVTMLLGHIDDGEAMANTGLTEATQAGLDTLGAFGLIDLSVVLAQKGQYERADENLQRSREIATRLGATRTAMRAQLEQASVKLQMHQPAEAVRLAAEPDRYYTEGKYVRLAVTAENISSRAQEELDNLVEATKLTTKVLDASRQMGDASLVSMSLETLKGQLLESGKLADALTAQEEVRAIYEKQHAGTYLAYALPQHAGILMRLGHTNEAGTELDAVEARIRSGDEAFKKADKRLASERTRLAAITGRYLDAMAFAKPLLPPPDKPDGGDLFAIVLNEYSSARLGRSGATAKAIAAWPLRDRTPATRRELSYWCAATLLARREYTAASDVAAAALSSPHDRDNPELAWRLAVIAMLAKSALADSTGSATMRALAVDNFRRLGEGLGTHLDAYLARPDVNELRNKLG